ncbi:Protein of unknown function [Pyronema omphalodes CBS 100304]|uniref:Uncharacterized protein n=1 Tax=Pyronema omphalodes (strain CBS 100304) TaxID=1076935 RepID=U4LFV7_PYROM|nr:Protein of unknown function [Pyronema omphalodes CBS 100304]
MVTAPQRSRDRSLALWHFFKSLRLKICLQSSL